MWPGSTWATLHSFQSATAIQSGSPAQTVFPARSLVSAKAHAGQARPFSSAYLEDRFLALQTSTHMLMLNRNVEIAGLAGLGDQKRNGDLVWALAPNVRVGLQFLVGIRHTQNGDNAQAGKGGKEGKGVYRVRGKQENLNC